MDLALKTYEDALKYAPGDVALSRGLDEWRREADAHRSFDERRYDQFRVLFEGREEKQLAKQATDIFHLAFRRICTKLGEFPTATIVAVLYTEQQFRDITRAPEWSSGEYDGRIRVPVAGAEQHPELFERVLTHELTHAVVANIAPRGVPVWLNEGLAQYFEGASADAARRRMRVLGLTIPLKDLEHGFARLGSRSAVQAAYDESLLAVSVILEKPGFIWSRLLHELEAVDRRKRRSRASAGRTPTSRPRSPADPGAFDNARTCSTSCHRCSSGRKLNEGIPVCAFPLLIFQNSAPSR